MEWSIKCVCIVLYCIVLYWDVLFSLKMLVILYFSRSEVYRILRYDRFCVGKSRVSSAVLGALCLVYVVPWISV